MAFLIDVAKASVWAVNALVGSATGGKVGIQEPPAKVVLVPPLFERDLRLRSRSAPPAQSLHRLTAVPRLPLPVREKFTSYSVSQMVRRWSPVLVATPQLHGSAVYGPVHPLNLP